MDNPPSPPPSLSSPAASPDQIASTGRRRLWRWTTVVLVALLLIASVLVSRYYSPEAVLNREVEGWLKHVRREEAAMMRGSSPMLRIQEAIESFIHYLHQKGGNPGGVSTQIGSYEVVEELSKMDRAILPILVKKLEKDPSVEVRSTILEVLAGFRDYDAYPLLERALVNDTASKVRETAARMASQYEPIRATPMLLAGLRNDRDPEVRREIASVMTALDAQSAVPALLKSFEGDTSTSVRSASARSLGHLGDKQAIPPLRKALASADNNLAKSAALGLADLRDPEVVPFLIQELQKKVDRMKPSTTKTNDSERSHLYSSDQIDTEIVQALGALADPRGVPVLLEALDLAEHDWNSEAIVEALVPTRDPRVVPVLVARLVKGGKRGKSAALGLGSIGGPEVFKALVEFLKEPDGDKKMLAAQALGRSGRLEALPILIGGLSSADDEVRKHAAEALGLIGSTAAVPELVKALKESNSDVLQEMIWALGHIGDQGSSSALFPLLKHKEFGVRFATVFALAGIQNPDAAPKIEGCLRDKEDRVVLAAACSLAFHGSDKGYAELCRGLKGREPWQRFAAAVGLFRLKTPNALAEVRSLAKDPDPSVRAFVNNAAEKGAPLALTELLKADSNDFRHYAARMLPFFRDPATIPALQAAVNDIKPEVRNAARVAVVHLERIAGK